MKITITSLIGFLTLSSLYFCVYASATYEYMMPNDNLVYL
jgi:hypothetical protein